MPTNCPKIHFLYYYSHDGGWVDKVAREKGRGIYLYFVTLERAMPSQWDHKEMVCKGPSAMPQKKKEELFWLPLSLAGLSVSMRRKSRNEYQLDFSNGNSLWQAFIYFTSQMCKLTLREVKGLAKNRCSLGLKVLEQKQKVILLLNYCTFCNTRLFTQWQFPLSPGNLSKYKGPFVTQVPCLEHYLQKIDCKSFKKQRKLSTRLSLWLIPSSDLVNS